MDIYKVKKEGEWGRSRQADWERSIKERDRMRWQDEYINREEEERERWREKCSLSERDNRY